jgi:hypothetical protein
MHLAQGHRPFGKELQAQLAIDDIERLARYWQFVSASFLPLEWRAGLQIRQRDRSSDAQHSRIEIDAQHCPSRTDARRSNARHNSSSARDVNYALARPRVGELHKDRSPFPKHRRNQLTLINLRCAARDLPLA